MRRGGGDLRGLGQHPRNPTKPHAPGSQHGLLTAVRQSEADGRFTFYRCACGAEVRRKHCDVDKSTRRGCVQACSGKCSSRVTKIDA